MNVSALSTSSRRQGREKKKLNLQKIKRTKIKFEFWANSTKLCLVYFQRLCNKLECLFCWQALAVYQL